jgi:hypothetical protein
MPGILLRLEGLVLLAAAVALYATQGFGWIAFGVLLLVPDLAALGYLIGVRAGSLSYNLAHALIVPVVLAVAAVLSGNALLLQLALIWLAHIGMDRAVGYGLKFSDSPRRTHLSDM